MLKQTKTKFRVVTKLKFKVIEETEPMPIDEAKEYGRMKADKMRAEHSGEWSVYLQCAIFTGNEQE